MKFNQTEQSDKAAELLKTLANPRRLQILCALAEGELNVSELNRRVDVSQSALSQHLAVLRQAQLVSVRKQAQVVFYQLVEGPAQIIIRILQNHFCDLSSSTD